MTDFHELPPPPPAPPLSAAPGQSGRRSGRIAAIAVSGGVVVAVAAFAFVHYRGSSSKVSQSAAYGQVNAATIEVVRALGQDPAQHPTFARVDHCDTGTGDYSGWRVSGGASLKAVAPADAAALGRRLETHLRGAGYSDVSLVVDGQNVAVRGSHGGVQVYLTYRPSETRDLLQFGAVTDCDVVPDRHPADEDGYPITDDSGKLLPAGGSTS